MVCQRGGAKCEEDRKINHQKWCKQQSTRKVKKERISRGKKTDQREEEKVEGGVSLIFFEVVCWNCHLYEILTHLNTSFEFHIKFKKGKIFSEKTYYKFF